MSTGGIIAGTILVALVLLLYISILIFLHCFGKIYRFTFPRPPPMYTEKFFGDKLKYANVYNNDGTIKNNCNIS